MTSTTRTLTPRFLPGETARLRAVECDCFVIRVSYLLGGVFEYSIEYWFDGLLRTATVYEHDLALIKKSTEPGPCDRIAGAKQADLCAASILDRARLGDKWVARNSAETLTYATCKYCRDSFLPAVRLEMTPHGVDVCHDRESLALGHYCETCLTTRRVEPHGFTPSKDDRRLDPLCVRCGASEAHPDHLHDYLGDRR